MSRREGQSAGFNVKAKWPDIRVHGEIGYGAGNQAGWLSAVRLSGGRCVPVRKTCKAYLGYNDDESCRTYHDVSVSPIL